MRSLSHATFLSPDGSAWKAGGRLWLDRNRRWLGAWTTNAKGTLNCMWSKSPDGLQDESDGASRGFGYAMWMYHFLVTELHRAAACKHMTGANQTAFEALADWCALQPVRWINEQPNGGWRYVGRYRTPLGSNKQTFAPFNTWAESASFQFSDSPPSVAGPWYGGDDGEPSYAAMAAWGLVDGPNYNHGLYVLQFWAALVVAVERGVPGSRTAWSAVQSNVTNLASWRTGFGWDARWGSVPRNT
jgi:hypothetical protein